MRTGCSPPSSIHPPPQAQREWGFGRLSLAEPATRLAGLWLARNCSSVCTLLQPRLWLVHGYPTGIHRVDFHWARNSVRPLLPAPGSGDDLVSFLTGCLSFELFFFWTIFLATTSMGQWLITGSDRTDAGSVTGDEISHTYWIKSNIWDGDETGWMSGWELVSSVDIVFEIIYFFMWSVCTLANGKRNISHRSISLGWRYSWSEANYPSPGLLYRTLFCAYTA